MRYSAPDPSCVPIPTGRRIRRVVLRFGQNDFMMSSMVNAIENGWEDTTLGLK